VELSAGWGTRDEGATDVVLTDDDLVASGSAVLVVPWLTGSCSRDRSEWPSPTPRSDTKVSRSGLRAGDEICVTTGEGRYSVLVVRAADHGTFSVFVATYDR